MPTPPDLAAVKVYLRVPAGDTSQDEAIASALAAETAVQQGIVRLPADPDPPAGPLPYPVDAAEALCRRVARNLFMRGLPSGLQVNASEANVQTVRIGADPEIRRLEARWRKLPVG